MHSHLQTYDQEFALTKPTESTLLGLKDKQIQSLQQVCLHALRTRTVEILRSVVQQLDDCRASIQQLGTDRQSSLEHQVVNLTQQRDELAQKLKVGSFFVAVCF